MRTLAIDLGSRRVGLALSDAGARFATPHQVLPVSSPQAAIRPVLDVIHKEDVKRIVVGLPMNMDGSIGPAARDAIRWAGLLATRTHLPILFVDERLSSFQAEQQIVSRKRAGEKLTRRRKRNQLDALAAAAFLQAVLDGDLRPVEVLGPLSS